MYAEFDQDLFGSTSPSFPDSSALLSALHAKYSMPYASGTHWQSTFGHLNTYGAAYYAYPWAQEIADEVYGAMSRDGLVNSKAGERLGGLLRPGGSREPKELVREALA